MLVLLVSERDVVVDDAPPLEDGSPPPTLTFQGLDVEGAGGRLEAGPDLVYRLAGRANLNPYGKHDELDGLDALPVYLELAAGAAAAFQAAQVAGHPVAGPTPSGVVAQRGHLTAVPALSDEALAEFVELGEREGLHGAPFAGSPQPHFDLGGFAAALNVGGITEGMVIRLSGFDDPGHNGVYEVGAVTPAEAGGFTAAVTKLGDTVSVLLEAAPQPVDAGALSQAALLDRAQEVADAIVDPALRSKAQAHIDGARAELGGGS